MRPGHQKVRKFQHNEEDAGGNGELGVELLRTSGGTAEDLAAKGLVHGGKLPGSGKDRMKEHE